MVVGTFMIPSALFVKSVALFFLPQTCNLVRDGAWCDVTINLRNELYSTIILIVWLLVSATLIIIGAVRASKEEKDSK